jgi:hypothetical protein
VHAKDAICNNCGQTFYHHHYDSDSEDQHGCLEDDSDEPNGVRGSFLTSTVRR